MKQNIADSGTMALQPGFAEMATRFNLDYGAGKVGCVRRNDMVRPIFKAVAGAV